jgi:hypothetical protein
LLSIARAEPEFQTRAVEAIVQRAKSGTGWRLPFLERCDEAQIDELEDCLPRRWKGERSSLESIGEILGETRDHHLYRKVGSETWSDYCRKFLGVPSEAMDKLIECGRIMRQAHAQE